MKEPIRMQEGDQLPAALREAFGSLGREAPSAETVLRVQRALSALPAAGPGAAAVGLGVGKLLVIATLVAGAVTTGVLLRGRLAHPPLPTTPSVQLAPAQPELVLPSEPSQVAAASPPPVAEPAPAAAANASAVEPAAELSKRRVKQRPASGARTPGAELSTQWVQGLLTTERAGSAPAQATPTEPEAAPEPAAPAAPPSASGTHASEAQRLAQCKRLAQRDPAEALRQVEALGRDVPNGVFVQERELLAIRLHQQLGHGETAAALTRSFLERHPNSVYRHKLAP